MTVFNYEKHIVADLWYKYQDTDKSLPYINKGDMVVVHGTEQLLENDADVTVLACADMLMTVVQTCKFDNDLWLYTVVGLNGSDVILADSDIAIVYKPIDNEVD